jgi:hypothetical protein
VCSLIKWQFKAHTSSFFEALWEAISMADTVNLARLERGFPEEVHAFIRWAHGNLGNELRKEGLDI